MDTAHADRRGADLLTLDTVRRLRRRWPVIVALTVAGALGGMALHLSDPTTYTSTARVLATDNAFTTPTALADEAEAVATTATRLDAAIADAGTDRTAAEVADQVSVEPLGDSPVLALRVSDADPEVASALTNSLAEQVVRTLATSRVDDADGERSSDRPVVIEQARPAAAPVPSRRFQDTVLGAFLGLIVGVGVAATLETLRPTLASSRAIADAFGTRSLGAIAPPGTPPEGGHVSPMLATTIAYSAVRADVSVLRLVAVDPLVNVEPLAADLRTTLPGTSSQAQDDENNTGAADPPLRVDVWAPYRDVWPDTDSKPVSSGLLIVAPSQVKNADVEPMSRIVDLVDAPVLGLLTYP